MSCDPEPSPVRSVAVLGAGTMGHGIAQVCAAAGLDTRLFDIDDEARCKRDRGENTYRKEVLDDEGNTVGAILIGDLGDRNKILKAISSSRKS